ncbi:MAG: S24 family peptidase [Planctomycetes bacterium]|nr:S24 family peptidase [Planctomycetota bacterium]
MTAPLPLRTLDPDRTYFPALPDLTADQVTRAPFMAKARGWCMWPNLWSEDAVLFQRASLALCTGQGAPVGRELARWEALHGKIVAVLVNGRPNVKRLHIGAGRFDWALMPDNPWSRFEHVADGNRCSRFNLHVYGVAVGVLPSPRDRDRLPLELRSEFDRLAPSRGWTVEA